MRFGCAAALWDVGVEVVFECRLNAGEIEVARQGNRLALIERLGLC